VVGGNETNATFARALGVLPDNSVKLFIAVEGPNDIAFLRTISVLLRRDDEQIPDLEAAESCGEIIFVPLGGSTLALWTSRLAQLNRPEFHLCDRDIEPPAPAKYESYVRDVSRRPNCRARSTAKREIENYLQKDAIISAYKENGVTLRIDANFGDFDDVPNEVARRVHLASGSPTTWEELSDEKKYEKESKAKRKLCAGAVRYMDRGKLVEIDPRGDLLAWFRDIAELLI
jgi:putative ATP-dependent endonuclease of the OLD family